LHGQGGDGDSRRYLDIGGFVNVPVLTPNLSVLTPNRSVLTPNCSVLTPNPLVLTPNRSITHNHAHTLARFSAPNMSMQLRPTPLIHPPHRLNIYRFINALDSAMAQEGCLVIMTTNHKEKLERVHGESLSLLRLVNSHTAIFFGFFGFVFSTSMDLLAWHAVCTWLENGYSTNVG
jgi:hypothetical protein